MADRLTPHEVSTMLAERIGDLCAYLLPAGRRENGSWRVGGVDGAKGGSLAIALTEKPGLWCDHATGEGGDALDLVKGVLGCDMPDALDWSRKWLGVDQGEARAPRPRPMAEQHDERQIDYDHPVAVYDYTDETGALLFQALRFETAAGGKVFRQRTGPDQKPWSIKGVRIVPYRLPELIEDIALGHTIFITEGEKDVDTLRAAGVPATCNPMGARKWRPEFDEIFRGADIVVCGDYDQPGREHVALVAKNLKPVAKRLRVLDLAKYWPEIGPGGDITDWFNQTHGTPEQLWLIVEGLHD